MCILKHERAIALAANDGPGQRKMMRKAKAAREK
jgi:hypothetical protein